MFMDFKNIMYFGLDFRNISLKKNKITLLFLFCAALLHFHTAKIEHNYMTTLLV